MSYMGQLAERDRELADLYAQQEEMQRRNFAFPQPALEPPPIGALADLSGDAGMRAGWLRNVNAVRPLSREGRVEEEESRARTTDPYMGSLELGLAAMPFSKPLRTGAIVGGALLAGTSEAEAGKKGLTGFEPGSLLGLHPSTKAREIHKQTLEKGGYSVNLPSGQVPTEGLMVGRYKNTDPRNAVMAREEFNPRRIGEHVTANIKELSEKERYLGTWLSPEDKVYLDVAQRFEPGKMRQAVKSGERTEQIAGRNLATGEDFPIGNWRKFVASPEFRERTEEMADVGRKYLDQFPTKEWWDMRGSPFERVYGTENLPQVAGYSASTAPVSNPTTNMQMMSEYMRRYLKGEPTIQPEFRLPQGVMGPQRAGTEMPMEAGRTPNLLKSTAGDLGELRRAKVREEGAALMGDPNAVVLDRRWANLTEAPERGIFANVEPGVIDTNIRKRGEGDYDYVKRFVTKFANDAGRSPRDYSADAWTGIRETIKRTNQLFGTPFRGSAVTGESKSYADIFQDLLEKKAKHLGISTDKLDERLRRGDADLLSTMMVGTPVLWKAYQEWQSSQQPKMGSVAAQDQYQ